MSSIIKSSFVSFSENKRTIEVIDHKNNRILSNPLDERVEHNNENIEDSNIDQEDMVSDDGISDPLAFIDSARDEAEKIIQLANDEAERIKEAAYKEGYDKGYKDAKRTATKEINKQKKEIIQQYRQLEIDRQNVISDIEPKVAKIITELVTSIVGKQEISQDTILFVVKKGLEEIELKGDIIIKVSLDDYDYINEYKEEIVGVLSNKIDVEFLKDASLNKNDCIIETDLGNIDCSLNSRLNGLISELKLIGESI